jgi:hypothetical protein
MNNTYLDILTSGGNPNMGIIYLANVCLAIQKTLRVNGFLDIPSVFLFSIYSAPHHDFVPIIHCSRLAFCLPSSTSCYLFPKLFQSIFHLLSSLIDYSSLLVLCEISSSFLLSYSHDIFYF